MVAARGVFVVVVEDAGLPIAKGDFYIGRAPLNERIPFFDDQAGPPLRVFPMDHPVADLQI